MRRVKVALTFYLPQYLHHESDLGRRLSSVPEDEGPASAVSCAAFLTAGDTTHTLCLMSPICPMTTCIVTSLMGCAERCRA